MNILALDIGGTDVKYGFFCGEKEELGKFPVSDTGMSEKIIEFIGGFEAEHIGLCAPGPFDFKSGTALMIHKLKSLYGISLKALIEEKYPDAKTVFIHDSTAFALGAMNGNPKLKNEHFCAVMLGTGLGYTRAEYGRVCVNETETPQKSIWNNPFKDGIAEEYVSATAIINRARSMGYDYNNVFDISTCAKSGDKDLCNLFYEVGRDLGEIISEKQKDEGFTRLVIGGGVSLSWELMNTGFESVCKIPHYAVENPQQCAVYGVKYCVLNGKENIYKF